MRFGHRTAIAARSIVLVAAAFVSAACHNWRPATRQPTEGAAVRIWYSSPRDLIATNGAGSSVRIAAVGHLTGTVVRVVADTMHVKVSSANGSPTSVPDWHTVAVVRGPDVTVTHRVMDRVKTVLAVWMVASLVSLIVFGPGDTSFY